jgi:DMSO/TMAO reductase YedYZ molybdopterin-dependent catalytic subunit
MTALLLALLLRAAPAPAPTLDVKGPLIKPASVTLKELAAFGSTTTEWADPRLANAKSAAGCGAPAKQTEAGCVHQVTGVRLDRLLLGLGFSEGPTGPQADPKQKHQGLRAAVVASARDGFEAVFSVGELLETLGTTTALVVWEQDGKALPDALGPLRILVLSDKGGARSLRQLTSLRVVDLKTP